MCYKKVTLRVKVNQVLWMSASSKVQAQTSFAQDAERSGPIISPRASRSTHQFIICNPSEKTLRPGISVATDLISRHVPHHGRYIGCILRAGCRGQRPRFDDCRGVQRLKVGRLGRTIQRRLSWPSNVRFSRSLTPLLGDSDSLWYAPQGRKTAKAVHRVLISP